MERRNSLKIALAALCLPLFLTSCGTKKVAMTESAKTESKANPGHDDSGILNDAASQQTFLQKILDNQVYTKNITGSMSFKIQMGDKDIEVNGALRMRKDEVVRIQLNAPILGFEVGRLEFTPDYVLIIDRLHKEYIKADYNQVDFLKNQGISFYSLQALFWNELTLPGVKQVTKSDLEKFNVGLSTGSTDVPVSYQAGRMAYLWNADRGSGRISQANVTFSASGKTSSVNMKYGKFKNVGVKMFPALQALTLTTNATKQKQEVKMTINMNEVKTDSKWEAQTEVPAKYKKVSPESVLSKIMNM